MTFQKKYVEDFKKAKEALAKKQEENLEPFVDRAVNEICKKFDEVIQNTFSIKRIEAGEVNEVPNQVRLYLDINETGIIIADSSCGKKKDIKQIDFSPLKLYGDSKTRCADFLNEKLKEVGAELLKLNGYAIYQYSVSVSFESKSDS